MTDSAGDSRWIDQIGPAAQTHPAHQRRPADQKSTADQVHSPAQTGLADQKGVGSGSSDGVRGGSDVGTGDDAEPRAEAELRNESRPVRGGRPADEALLRDNTESRDDAGSRGNVHSAGEGAHLTDTEGDERTPSRDPVDLNRIEGAVREILLAVGENPERDGLRHTPERVARAYAEAFKGLHQDPAELLGTTFDIGHEELVLVRDVSFYSMCEHHLVPFFGTAHIGYIPAAEGKVTGLSKLARLVDLFAKRPQVQEQLTSQIVDALMTHLEPQGAIVVVEAEHLCMSMRGVSKPGAKTITSAVRGQLRDAATRSEAMSLMMHGR